MIDWKNTDEKLQHDLVIELNKIMMKNCKHIATFGLKEDNKILISQNTQLQLWIQEILFNKFIPEMCKKFFIDQEFFEIREQPVNFKQYNLFNVGV